MSPVSECQRLTEVSAFDPRFQYVSVSAFNIFPKWLPGTGPKPECVMVKS